MAWQLAGRQLSIGWALALCYHVGFRGKDLTVAVALMTAESGRYTEAWHENIAFDPDVFGDAFSTTVDSIDRGLFQINSKWHADLSEEDAFKAIPNARYAYAMSSGMYFSPWMAYTSGAYEKYMLPVWVVRTLGVWKRKLPRVEQELG